jgi:hypothetical protein
VGLRDSGSSRLNLPRADERAKPLDDLLTAVREAASAEFVVLGEMGRGGNGIVAYLARDRADGKLVALKVTPDPRGGNEYTLDVAKQLDASVPAPSSTCPSCGVSLRGWHRFCTQCGINLWSDRSAGEGWNKTDLLKAVEQAVHGKFEILGEMDRAEGGGTVYFARELESGRLEALRLQHEGNREFSIGLTGVLQRFAGSIGTYRPPGPA